MVTFDKDEMNKLSGLTDSDGKIIISDDMPEDLKAAISYLNENNVSIFSPSDPSAYVDDEEPDPFAPGFVDSSDSNMDEEEDLSDDELDDDSDSVDDLANVF